MKTLTISQVQARFKDLAKLAQDEPIQIKDEGAPDCVILSLEDYDQLKSKSLNKEQPKVSSEPLVDRVRKRFSDFDQRIDWGFPERQTPSEDRIPFSSSK